MSRNVTLTTRRARPVADDLPIAAPRLIVGVDERGDAAWGFADVEFTLGITQLQELLGTASSAFAKGQIDALFNTLAQGFGRPPDQSQLEAALALIAGVRPRDEVEAALAVQMAVTHAVALRLGKRMLTTDPLRHDFESTGIIASKFMRTFTGQVEALTKLRRPAVQVVRVERLNVSDGGNAIVGTVSPMSHEK